MQLEHLFSQTKDLPLEAVERLLGALLSSRDPATPRHPPTPPGNYAPGVVGGNLSRGGGDTLERGEGRAWVGAAAASFEAHAVLALELSSRVVLANRHRVSRLWPSLHSFLARWVLVRLPWRCLPCTGGSCWRRQCVVWRVMWKASMVHRCCEGWVLQGLASSDVHGVREIAFEGRTRLTSENLPCPPIRLLTFLLPLSRVLGGEGSLTMIRLPFLVERAMVTVLRACIHMLDRKDMEVCIVKLRVPTGMDSVVYLCQGS